MGVQDAGARGFGRLRCLPLALLAVVTLAGCGGTDRVRVAVLDYGVDGPRTLTLFVNACMADARIVSLRETADEVRLAVEADEPGEVAPACAEGVSVALESPLDGRTVIDETTGMRVPRTG